MSFYDEIIEDTLKDDGEAGKGIVKMLRQAHVIRADNVMRYYSEDIGDQETVIKQIGATVPPFPFTWIESAHPAKHRLPERTYDWPDKAFRNVGILLRRDDATDPGERWQVKWCMFWKFPPRFLAVPTDPDMAVYPTVMGQFALDEMGKTIEGSIQTFPLSATMNEEMVKILQWSLTICWDFMVISLSFMNCKNVTLDPVTPAPPVRTAEQKRRNIWPKPEHDYHVIHIQPLRATPAKAEAAAPATSEQIAQRLHIVRGHFHHYSEDKPLFGKPGLFGQFWIPQHISGRGQGAIEADYQIDV